MAAGPRHSGSRLLRSGDLCVEVLDTSQPESSWYHTGPRFSPLACVLAANYQGVDYLYSPVDHDPASEQCGLAMEFDLTTAPTNFDATDMGGHFLKVGVGVLEKIVDRYSFSRPYPIVQRAETRVSYRDDGASYSQTSPACDGYQYQLDADLSVGSDSITFRYTLANCGDRQLSTWQYHHNYFCFDGAGVGPDYRVEFPHAIEATGLEAEQRVDGQAIQFHAPIPTHVNIRVPVPPAAAAGHCVGIQHGGSGLGLQACTSWPVDYVAIHANPRYLAPEQFIRLDLAPGDQAQWTRSFRFSR